MSENPNKRLRLDVSDSNDLNAMNEDMWDKDDMTAEEFDMLEMQATQALNHTSNQLPNQSVDSLGKDMLRKEENFIQLQYQLEGRIKLLSQSLEKCTKELMEERRNREKIVTNKMKEVHEKEANLIKEIEKMQSALKFKDQEMKSVYSKLHFLKSQVGNKKERFSETENQSVDNGFQKINIEPEVKRTTLRNFQRKYVLSVDVPLGESKNIDILSSILCSRFTVPQNCLANHGTCMNYGASKSTNNLSAMCLVKVKNEQNCDEFLDHYTRTLNVHVDWLKSYSSNSVAAQKEGHSYQFSVLHILKDLQVLMSCQRFSPVLNNIEKEAPNVKNEQALHPDILLKCDIKDSGNISSLLLNSLIELANPSIYPKENCGLEEIKLSLFLLLRLCNILPQRLIKNFSMLPVEKLMKMSNMTIVCIVLNIISILSSFNDFIVHIVHKDGHCFICTMAEVLQDVQRSSAESFSIPVISILDGLSAVLTVHSCTAIMSQASECFNKVIHSLIVCLLQYIKLEQKSQSVFLVLKKGLLLLHFMCNNIQDFKERRNAVEDKYICLISSYILLCKEDLEFKDLYDFLNNLWDLQNDVNDCDYEEVSEEMDTA